MKIVIGGDLYAGDWSAKSQRDVSAFWAGIENAVKAYDFRIVNLESPVTIRDAAIQKTGPNLKSNLPDFFFTAGGIDVVTLANNHVMDFGAGGLQDTLDYCLRNEIKSVGAGMEKEANRFLILEHDDQKVAVINFAENEWLQDGNAGAFGMDPIDIARTIKIASDIADYTLVVAHCGSEHYSLPSPRTKKTMRFLVEQGADAVVCHHSHCVSGYEVYQGRPIFYGLGNFYFPYNEDFSEWRKGMLVGLDFSADNISFELIPVEHDDNKVCVARNVVAFQQNIASLSSTIADDKLLEYKWNEWCEKKVDEYASYVTVKNQFLRKVLLKLGVFRFLSNSSFASRQINYIRCESHRDILLSALNRFR